MIYITGDTHQLIDFKKIINFRQKMNNKLTKQDYLIIAGDFGFIWSLPDTSEYKTEQKWLEWFDKECSWTTLFIDGNHENFIRLKYDYPIENKFGGVVSRINDSVYWLHRSQVFTIEDKTILALGGGTSLDKANRIPFKSWWPDEDITNQDLMTSYENLKSFNFNVDYVITHAGPTQLVKLMFENFKWTYFPDNNSDLLDELYSQGFQFKHWYFGHYHLDYTNHAHKFTALYQDIKELGGDRY